MNRNIADQIFFSSPIKLLAIIAASIFIAEAISMTAMHLLQPFRSEFTETLFDSTFLVLLLSPIFYLMLFRPMLANISDRRRHEQTLLEARDMLEFRVAERTAELLKANELLLGEVTVREKAEEDLKRTYEFAKTVLDSMQDAIAIIDVASLKIIGVNSMFLVEYGLSDETEALGRTCHEVTHGRLDVCTPPDDICPLLETVQDGRHTVVEHIHYDRAGARRHVEVATSPVFGEEGNITRVIHVSRDITDRKHAEETVAKSEEELRMFINSSQEMVYRTDAGGFFTLINEAGARLFGYCSPEEMLGKKAEEFWRNNEDRDAFLDLLRKEKRVKAYPIFAKDRDGMPIELEATSRVIESSDGRFLGIEGIILDVSERNRKEQELKKSQEDLLLRHQELNALFSKVESVKKEWESSMDSTGDMIILVDSRGLVKRCNRTFMNFSGRTFEGLLWKDWDSLLEEMGFVLNTMFQSSTELFHETSNRWFQLTSHPFKDIEGLEGSVVTIHDTTEMKNITDALEITNRQIEENRVKLQNALDEISNLIQRVTMKKDFSVRFANPNLRTCYEAMNCSKTGCPCFGKETERCWQIAGTFCGGRVQGEFAEKFDNCAECPTYQFATSDPIYQIGESFNNMMHILELQHAEIEKAYNDLKVAQSQITQQEKMASIGQLAAGVAHEINNPTGFIMSNLGSFQKYVDRLVEFMGAQAEVVEQLSLEQREEIQKKRKALKVDFITEDVRSLVKESLDGAERIKKIVQDLKSFSRVDEAELKMADINAGLESTINIVWNELKYKVTLHKEYGDIPQTKCNPGQLNQVFMNMLVNAAHAIEKQGELTVKTWFIPSCGGEEKGSINISIADTGSGIPADKLNRIFEPFYTTKEVGKGTGLGLSIAYDIVKKHKGEIMVESEVGKGTTFTVRIPLVEA